MICIRIIYKLYSFVTYKCRVSFEHCVYLCHNNDFSNDSLVEKRNARQTALPLEFA
jgi:hypothetical protein